MITCPKCEKSLANSKFPPRVHRESGRYTWCRLCKKAYQKEYSKLLKRDPSYKSKEKGRFRFYGLIEQDYLDLLKIQGGVCAGCRKPPKDKRLAIDHEHQSEDKKREPWEKMIKVRGLLCSACNRLLGRVRDNHKVLHNLSEYLKKWPSIPVISNRYENTIQKLGKHEE